MTLFINHLGVQQSTISPDDTVEMFQALTLIKHITNSLCPPSIRRLPNNFLTLIGLAKKVVKEYLSATAKLLPALADAPATADRSEEENMDLCVNHENLHVSREL
ncbi:hypothetical protein LXL04_008079 [Taraxacum kok-saghyz]